MQSARADYTRLVMVTPHVTIGEWITLSAERRPDKPCLTEAGGATCSFGAMNEQVNRLVHSLRAKGVGRGDRVAVIAADSAPFVTTILAAMKLGATYVPLNTRLVGDEVRTLVDRARPTVVCTTPAAVRSSRGSTRSRRSATSSATKGRRSTAGVRSGRTCSRPASRVSDRSCRRTPTSWAWPSPRARRACPRECGNRSAWSRT